MSKTFLAAAYLLCWLSTSAQIENKQVFSLGVMSPSEIEANVREDDFLADFKLVGGLIFVQGVHDGEEASYILDTGAPGLILNNKIDKENYDDAYIASGLTGNTSIAEFTIEEFKILNITKSDFRAYQMDLGHIEDEILHQFAGLVGGDLFDNTILLLDYPNRKWGTVKSLAPFKVKHSIPFTQEEHFIIVQVEIAGESMRMILDTGAEISILDLHASKLLRKSVLKDAGSTSIQSASRNNTSTNNVNVHKFKIQNLQVKNHEFSVLNFDFINEGLDKKLDGLIGFPFFEGKKIAFDFTSEMIYIIK